MMVGGLRHAAVQHAGGKVHEIVPKNDSAVYVWEYQSNLVPSMVCVYTDFSAI